jgi:hypothetical protein
VFKYLIITKSLPDYSYAFCVQWSIDIKKNLLQWKIWALFPFSPLCLLYAKSYNKSVGTIQTEIQLKILHTNTTLKKSRIAAMFVNGLIGMKWIILERTFHRCILPSFGSFSQAVLEEKIQMWKVNRWRTPKWWLKLTRPLARWTKNVTSHMFWLT